MNKAFKSLIEKIVISIALILISYLARNFAVGQLGYAGPDIFKIIQEMSSKTEGVVYLLSIVFSFQAIFLVIEGIGEATREFLKNL